MNNMKYPVYFLAILVLLYAGCRQSRISPTKGTITVEVDSSIAPIIKKEAKVFDSLYVNAKLILDTVSPVQGMVDLLNKKVRMYVCPRYFNNRELDFIKKEKLDIKTFKFCYNALAVIASAKNPLSELRTDVLKDELLGKRSGNKIIIPPPSTSTYQYIMKDILDGKDPAGARIEKNEEEILNKIRNSDDELGIVSFNLVQDSSGIKFIKLGDVNHNNVENGGKNLEVNYFTPHPGFVLKNYYSYKQTVYIYLSEVEMSPASGFTTFLTNYEGQKIALGENLAPLAVPVKINEFQ